jgi:uncharacterized protein
MGKSIVYYGSPRQARLDAKETLPAKLELIIDQLHIRDRVKGENVILKMHLGNNLSYSVIHPLFVRKVVQAVKDGGGKVFIADVEWDVHGHETRGYTHETVGCPIYPAAGLQEKYFYTHHHPFKSIQDWQVAGMIQDASFMINFAHIKGHPSCGFGGNMKNIALGCMTGVSRSAIHDTCHFDPYWFSDKCPDPAVRQQIIDACPFNAVVEDKHHPGELHLHIEECNQCGRCLQVAPEGSLLISPTNFHAFQEACAISTAETYATFAPEKITNISLATHMTPVCDCFGFTGMPILPDAGIFGSDDIVANDQAALDMTGKTHLIEENVPTSMEIHTRTGHPFQVLHGPLKDPYKVLEYAEALGLGSREYELVDVLPVEEFSRRSVTYIAAQ